MVFFRKILEKNWRRRGIVWSNMSVEYFLAYTCKSIKFFQDGKIAKYDFFRPKIPPTSPQAPNIISKATSLVNISNYEFFGNIFKVTNAQNWNEPGICGKRILQWSKEHKSRENSIGKFHILLRNIMSIVILSTIIYINKTCAAESVYHLFYHNRYRACA